MCTRGWRSNLKSPSSAVFCSYPDARINNKGDNEYWVTGYVDANNSFGTSVRSEFTVTLTLTEYGYKNANCYFGDDSIRLIAGSIADEYGFSDETTEETISAEHKIYDAAMTYYNSGDLVSALAEFEKCCSYEDSDEYISELKEKIYQQAKNAIENGDNKSALELLEVISGYKDVDVLIFPVKDAVLLDLAEEYYSVQEYDDTINVLSKLSEQTEEAISLRNKAYEGQAYIYFYEGDIDGTLSAISKMTVKTDTVVEMEDEIAVFVEKYGKWLGKWSYRVNSTECSLWIRAQHDDGLKLAFETGKTTTGDVIVYDVYQYNENQLIYHSDRFGAFEYTTLRLVDENTLETSTEITNTGTVTKTRTMYRIE